MEGAKHLFGSLAQFGIYFEFADGEKFIFLLLAELDDQDWEFSSAGRAPALQAGGQRFEPVNSHKTQKVP